MINEAAEPGGLGSAAAERAFLHRVWMQRTVALTCRRKFCAKGRSRPCWSHGELPESVPARNPSPSAKRPARFPNFHGFCCKNALLNQRKCYPDSAALHKAPISAVVDTRHQRLSLLLYKSTRLCPCCSTQDTCLCPCCSTQDTRLRRCCSTQDTNL